MAKVRIKNISGYPLNITLPNVRYRRELMPGQIAPLNEDVFDEFNYDPGCRVLVKKGFVSVLTDDEEVKSYMPAVPENADVDVAEVLLNGTVADLAKLLRNGTDVIKERVVAAAIQHNVIDAARCELIKTYCEVNILTAIANQRAAEV